MANKKTIFQRLESFFGFGGTNASTQPNDILNHNIITNGLIGNDKESEDEVIYKTEDKEEYERKLLQLKQDQILKNRWYSSSNSIENRILSNLTNIRLMYMEADLMDDFPEIGAGLDIIMEEICHENKNGNILNIYSNNERIKRILEDLFYNRLSVDMVLPMIARAMVKYGNHYMLLNLDESNGVIGWKQMPVEEVERHEGNIHNYHKEHPSFSFENRYNTDGINNSSTFFTWINGTNNVGHIYKNWNIAHFRLLYDQRFYPYGMSYLHKARRHFRMLSMSEDMMLLYRLERSMSRRNFKIEVGSVAPEDLDAYLQKAVSSLKRKEVIDPETGQIDMRKNILNISQDYFTIMRGGQSMMDIETIEGLPNVSQIEDVQYFQKKVCASLKLPEGFLNFTESTNEGRSLSSLDIRFAKTITRLQKFIILELNKIAIIHLKMLGFDDELNNFTITMNNPSMNTKIQELELLSKQVQLVKDAITDPGNMIPVMSVSEALSCVMGKSQNEIKKHLSDVRLEKALEGELEKTGEIINRTGVFDEVDRLYGVANAKYNDTPNVDGLESGGSNLSDMSTGSMSDSDMFPDSPSEGGDSMEGNSSDMEMGGPEGDGPAPVQDSIEKRGELLNEEYKKILKRLGDFNSSK